MTIGNAIVNQALGAANRQAVGGLKKVMGNLPGSALGGGGKGVTNPGIAGSPSTSMNLSYPLDVESADQQGHYMMFFINVSDPALVKKAKEEKEFQDFRAGYLGEEQQTGVSLAETDSRIMQAPPQAISVKRPPTVKLARAISLYMPPQVRATYSVSTTDQEMGSATELAAGAFQNAVKTAQAEGIRGFNPFKANWSKTGQSMVDAAVPMTGALVKNALGTFGPLAGLAGGFNALEIATGKIISSKMELVFTGVGRRKFNYTFTFLPKSEEESKMVDEIVKTFKRHMIPDFAEVGMWGISTNSGRILKIPDTFDIQYMYHAKENPWYNKISTCMLTNMDVQYGSANQTFYEPLEHPSGEVGPPPQQTNLTLAFEEMEKMSRPRIDQGF